jgi:hypothetical protein
MLPLKLPTSLCVLVLLPAAACFASALEDQDNAPVSGIYNFVDSTEGAELLPKGSVAWTLVAMTSSHAIAERSGNEALVFDGETTRTEFRLRYAVSDELELGIEIPYLWHSPGELDQFIDAWHDTFGLPGGSRTVRGTDLLEFSYRNTDGLAFNFRESEQGFGDARLTAGWRLGRSASHRRAFRFGMTLPTGDATTFTGSDAVTVSAGFAGDVRSAGSRWSSYYRVHATWLDEGAVLPLQQRNWIAHAAAGLGFRATPGIDLRAQLLVRSATHESDIEVLGEAAAILTVGGNIRIGNNYELSLAVGEDIKVTSSPDVSFLVSLRYRPSAPR